MGTRRTRRASTAQKHPKKATKTWVSSLGRFDKKAKYRLENPLSSLQSCLMKQKFEPVNARRRAWLSSLAFEPGFRAWTGSTVEPDQARRNNCRACSSSLGKLENVRFDRCLSSLVNLFFSSLFVEPDQVRQVEPRLSSLSASSLRLIAGAFSFPGLFVSRFQGEGESWINYRIKGV